MILDPTIFCGGNTTLESLAMGTPVVTLPSPYSSGRLTLAMYRRMEFLELVARDADDYVRIALALGRDRERRTAAKHAIAERVPILFEDSGAVRSQERLFEELPPPASRLGAERPDPVNPFAREPTTRRCG